MVLADCSGDQVMFKVYQNSNSHVALNSDSGDALPVCFSDITGYNYGGASPHTCNGNNSLFYLYRDSNSHVSSTQTVDYDIPICYGDLKCEIKEDACGPKETVLASLESEYNSHVSVGDDEFFKYKVCCPDLQTDVYWADMNFNEISQVKEGSQVRLYAERTSEDAVLEFLLYEKDGGFFGLWDSRVEVDAYGRSSGLWEAEIGEYYFKVKVNGAIMKDSVGEDMVSGMLVIGYGVSDITSNITILSPNCGDDIPQGENMNIVVAVEDPDDLIYGDLTVNGEWIANVSNEDNVITIVNYTFNDYGEIQIAINSVGSRKMVQRVITNIMVINSAEQQRYTAACIDEPKNFESLGTSTVGFNAESSSGIDCSSGECLRLDYYSERLNYLWTFSTCDRSGSCDGFEKIGSLETAHHFVYNYPYPGNNWAKLKVEMI